MAQLQRNLGQKLFHYNPCRVLQRGQSPASWGHKHGQGIYSPLKNRQQLPDSSSRLVSIWLFQQQVLHQQLFYVSSKNMKYWMGAQWTQPTEQSTDLGWKLKILDEIFCTQKTVSIVKAGLPPCAPGNYRPRTFSDALGCLGGLFIINTRLGAERNRRVEGTEAARVFHRHFTEHFTRGKLSLLTEEKAITEPHVWSRVSLINESAWIQASRQAESSSLAMNNTDGQSLTCWIANEYWGSVESEWLLEICSADNSKDKLA